MSDYLYVMITLLYSAGVVALPMGLVASLVTERWWAATGLAVAIIFVAPLGVFL